MWYYVKETRHGRGMPTWHVLAVADNEVLLRATTPRSNDTRIVELTRHFEVGDDVPHKLVEDAHIAFHSRRLRALPTPPREPKEDRFDYAYEAGRSGKSLRSVLGSGRSSLSTGSPRMPYSSIVEAYRRGKAERDASAITEPTARELRQSAVLRDHRRGHAVDLEIFGDQTHGTFNDVDEALDYLFAWMKREHQYPDLYRITATALQQLHIEDGHVVHQWPL
jgi:hypothetical protein